MSEPAVSALAPLPFELVYDDGEPLESNWHRYQMNLLIDLIYQAMAERGRDDYFASGNMFVYYSLDQARDVACGRPYFRGPDVFFVNGVDGRMDRKAWVSWDEGGRLPDVIVELLSASTARVDRIVKKDLYARVFRTPEYFLYDPERQKLEGLRLSGDAYQPIRPDAGGRFKSKEFGLALGLWQGVHNGLTATWVRLFRPDGSLVPTEVEAHRQRAEAERQAKEAAEAEVARLRARIAELGGNS